ncbi:MAG: 4-hydroxy-tetrahydrodipicolinate synthase [Limnochordia bacterium]|jgi:4-hydroxy-tetrahydrodipicolinate synthase|nr:4-hydroxy-tetrahydrodipicolinate synthase [Bacillota bacterium]NLL08444.1 4-hydroxy-tetrahydrodipicolinate synthase [Bacillota bacterium]HBG09065.1 4-hydroxy-tetrahydrodipicolinate synthase [Bacillota bacterium]
MKSGQVLTAMITPMNRDQSVNYTAAVELAQRLGENGSDGVVLSGTTGESPNLSFEEKVKLFSAVTDALGGQMTIIAGTGSNSTQDSILLTKAAEKAGVDGIMLVAPYYNKPSQEGLYQHFKTVAEQTTLPVMIYNVPGRTSVNILPETVARLAEIENIVAIKEASGNLEQVSVLKTMVPEDFLIYSGDDALTLPILAVGGAGVVSVASHLVGREIKAMISAFLAGKVGEALEIHLKLMPLFQAMFLTTNPVPVKRALEFMGVDTGPLRLPLVDLTEQEAQKIKEVLFSMGLGS